MTSDQHALSRCVGDPEWFGRHHWGQAPVVRRSGSFEDLLTVEGVERLLSAAARRPSFRLVRDGETLCATGYTRPVRLGGTTIEDAADLDRIAGHLGEGATLVLQGLHHTWPPLMRFCDDLALAITHPVQANAYLSPPGACGLRRHHDLHEVFALQCAGAKTWQIDGLGVTTLEAGDVLYVPAGVEHSAASAGFYSLHVTVGVLAVTYGQVVRRFLDRLEGEHHRPLPLGYALPERLTALGEGVSNALAGAHAALADVKEGDVVAAEIARARRARSRRSARGALQVVVDPDSLGDGIRLRRARGVALHIDSDGDDAIVSFDGRRLRMPGSTRAALDVMATKDDFLVAELPGLDRPSRAVISRRLLREGLLELV